MRVLLALLSKEGLFAVAICAIALYQTYATVSARAENQQLKAIAEQLAAHNHAMEQLESLRQADESERRASERMLRTLLRGICIGTSGDIPQARALCELQTENR